MPRRVRHALKARVQGVIADALSMPLRDLDALARGNAARIESLLGQVSRLRRDNDELRQQLTEVRNITAASFDRVPELREQLLRARAQPQYGDAFDDPEPLISVRIATRNRSALLMDRAIASVLAQTYTNFEVVVVGEGCDDDTGQRIAALGDPRVRFTNLAHPGVYPADPLLRWRVAGTQGMNHAAQLARGTWIAPLDDDDEFTPRHLQDLLDAALSGRFEMVYGKYRHGPSGELVGVYPPQRSQCGLQAAMYLTALRFFESDPRSWVLDETHDWHLVRRMLESGVRIGFADHVVTIHHPSGQQSRIPQSAHAPIHGGIEAPDGRVPMRRGALTVRGWALGTASPVARVEIRLGGHSLGLAGLMRPRPDVAAAAGRQNAELSGFELHADLDGLVEVGDRAPLWATVTLLDGTQADLRAVDLDLPPAEALPTWAAPPPPARRPSNGAPVRVLWFVHSLEHGGSQLRLTELVEHLQQQRGFHSTVLSAAEGPLRCRLQSAGAVVRVVEPIPMSDAAAYENRLSALTQWASEDFDLVVAQNLPSFPAIDLAHRLGLPCVWRIGESEALSTVVERLYGEMDPAVELQARRALTRASAVVCNSRAAALRLEAGGLNGGRVALIPTGVDTGQARAHAQSSDRADCRRTLGVHPDRRLLVCAGAFRTIKGQAMLASALGEVRDEHPELECVLIGEAADGPYARAVSRYADAHALGDSLRLLPFSADLHLWWRAADVGVCPSETESMPAAVLEAMAYGLPVLASRTGDIPRLVEPGVTGWLFDANDLASLVAALRQVAAAPTSELHALGAVAADRVARDHDRGEALARMTDLLREVTYGATRGQNPAP